MNARQPQVRAKTEVHALTPMEALLAVVNLDSLEQTALKT
jgi:hypothetical protein